MTNVTTNLLRVKNQIAEFEQKYHREPHSVQLLAVTKKQPAEVIQEAVSKGQFAFGESYVQEALSKMSVLKDTLIEWHFIGNIQTNKTRKIAEHFAWVHSVGSAKIAARLDQQRPSYLPPLNVCLEVNVSHETSKSGLNEKHVLNVVQFCQTLKHVKVRGLMTIPAPTTSLHQQREAFHKLVILFQAIKSAGFQLDTLSMGMSEDFEAGIAEGSTIVRIGTAIFGER